MLKIIEYFTGTAKMYAAPENKNKALSYMQKNGVFFAYLHEKDGGAYFTVLKKSLKDEALLQYASVLEIGGFVCDLKKSFRRPGLYIGAVTFIIALILSDSIVWDVRYSPTGNENVERIAAVINGCGLKSGAFKSGIDKDEIENLVMLKCPDVSYVNINVTGSVATVTTDERLIYDKPEDKGKTDLCASEDGYIIRYETYAGQSVCEKGQTVKQGDVLITGSYETFHHGTVTVKAKGRVYALVKRSFLCECKDTVDEKVYTGEKFVKRALSVFSYQLGGGAEYDPEKYEKTTESQTVSVFNVVDLPLKINTQTFREYSTVKRKISEAEAEKILRQTYEKQYKDITKDAEVQSTETKKYYKDGKYCLYCEVYMICNIAK